VKKLLKYKEICSMIICDIIFVLLLISIVRSVNEIYTTSTVANNPKVCVPIIMYHQVKSKNLGKDVISPAEFENDLKYLSENNYTTITMTELINYVYNGTQLPENPIILSFDDGYYSTYKYVYPLLKEYNMKIVLAIIGKSTDDYSKVNDTNVEHAHLTWDHVSEMAESGLVEIQNHSYNLHKIAGGRYGSGQMQNESLSHYGTTISEDINILQEKITSIINISPNTYAYPYGKYNDNTDNILKECGFKATLSVTYGVNLISRDNPDKLFGLKRICRAHNQTIGKVLKDGMETLRFSSE
jgi:peptidoglycan/xylan/chitin deacetylase (PgdA/CDA1 family)